MQLAELASQLVRACLGPELALLKKTLQDEAIKAAINMVVVTDEETQVCFSCRQLISGAL